MKPRGPGDIHLTPSDYSFPITFAPFVLCTGMITHALAYVRWLVDKQSWSAPSFHPVDPCARTQVFRLDGGVPLPSEPSCRLSQILVCQLSHP